MANNVLEKTLRLRDNFTKGLQIADRGIRGTTRNLENLRNEGNRRMEVFLATDKAQSNIAKLTRQYDGMSDALKDEITNQQSYLDALSNKIAATAKKSNMLKQNLANAVSSNDTNGIIKYQSALANTDMQLLRSGDSVNKFKQQIAMLTEALSRLEQKEKASSKFSDMESFGAGKIQKAIAWTQTLLDKVDLLANKSRQVTFGGMERGVNLAINATGRLLTRVNQVKFAGQQLSQGSFGQKMFDGASNSLARLQTRLIGFKSSLNKTDAGALTKGLNAAAKAMGTVTKLGLTAGRNITWAFTQVGKQIASLPRKAAQLPLTIAKSVKQMMNLKNETSKTGDKMQSLNRIANLLTFGAAIAAVQKLFDMIDKVASKADEIVNAQAKFNLMLDTDESGKTLEDMNKQVLAAAERSRSSWQDTANFVARLGMNAEDAFGNTDEIIAFSEILNKAYKVGGATAQEQRSSMLQLEQAMAAGVLQGQELNSILRGAPQVAKAIADYMGVTRGELKALGKDGEITSDVVKNAVFAAADQINEKFATIPMTWETMWTHVKNVALWAFLPLVDKFNEFLNSEPGQKLFQAFSAGMIMLANLATWVFDVIVAGITWAQNNMNVLANVALILGTIMVAAAIAAAAAWAVANWPLLLIIAIIWTIISVLNDMGISTQQIAAVMAGAIGFVAVAFYDAVVWILGIFKAFLQILINAFSTWINFIISIAEFFMNVWNHPVYSVQKLFYNLMKHTIDYWAAIADGAANVGEVIAKAILSGVNLAIKGINWLIDALNKIPGFDIGKVGEVDTDVDFSGVGTKMRNWVEKLNPGEAPEGYKSLDKYKLGMMDVTGLDWALNNTKNPMDGWDFGYNAVNNFDLDGVLDGLKDIENIVASDQTMQNVLGNGVPEYAGPNNVDEVEEVKKVRDDISITDEDLKYMRDVAEKAFIMNYRQVSPNATLNYTTTNGDGLSPEAMLDKMEKMIVDQVASELT